MDKVLEQLLESDSYEIKIIYSIGLTEANQLMIPWYLGLYLAYNIGPIWSSYYDEPLYWGIGNSWCMLRCAKAPQMF